MVVVTLLEMHLLEVLFFKTCGACLHGVSRPYARAGRERGLRGWELLAPRRAGLFPSQRAYCSFAISTITTSTLTAVVLLVLTSY